jgi:hypothetical protein
MRVDLFVLALTGTGMRELSAKGILAYSAIKRSRFSIEFNGERIGFEMTLTLESRKHLAHMSTESQTWIMNVRLLGSMAIVKVVRNDDVIPNAEELHGVADLGNIAHGLMSVV